MHSLPPPPGRRLLSRVGLAPHFLRRSYAPVRDQHVYLLKMMSSGLKKHDQFTLEVCFTNLGTVKPAVFFIRASTAMH